MLTDARKLHDAEQVAEHISAALRADDYQLTKVLPALGDDGHAMITWTFDGKRPHWMRIHGNAGKLFTDQSPGYVVMTNPGNADSIRVVAVHVENPDVFRQTLAEQ